MSSIQLTRHHTHQLTEPDKLDPAKRLGHDVRDIVSRCHWRNFEVSELDVIPNSVVSHVYVFGPLGQSRVFGKTHCLGIVLENLDSLCMFLSW